MWGSEWSWGECEIKFWSIGFEVFWLELGFWGGDWSILVSNVGSYGEEL